jgi:hypothetical protein
MKPDEITAVLRGLSFRSGIETVVAIDKPAAGYLIDCVTARTGKP